MCAGLLLLISSGPAGANTWILPNEVGRAPAPSKMIEAFNPFAPQVFVDSPDLVEDGVTSPVKVVVRFVPKNGARIVLDSVRVLYVTFFSNIDITDRIRDKITAAGIRDDNADLPSGSHHLIIKVSDDRGLEVKKEFAVNVR
jgi:hypothetical protein